MLKKYKEQHQKTTIQYSVLDFDGTVLESDNSLFPKIEKVNITTIHPFFETIIPLLVKEDKETIFSCVHLDIKDAEAATDIILYTFKDKNPLLVIYNLTSHYNNYQTTAQIRNESVINSQILELKNSYLKEKEAFKNTFIANFSHELRDPLTGILTFTDILNKTNLDEKQKSYIEILNTTSESLRKMIDDILDLSQIEAGKLELTIEPFNFKQLLNDIKFRYAIKAEQEGLEFICNFNENLPETIGGDANRLRQVISNLLDNAIKFTNNGTITFTVSLNQIRAQKASIHFNIADTGIGIKKEDIDTIFTSFTQVNKSDVYNGTGLGLAIVKYLVELTNSKISVESEYGKGSTFSTNINFIHNPSLKTSSKDDKLDAEFGTSKKFNILLVEDSQISQISVLKILASQRRFFLDIATTAEDALARISSLDNEVDLVLMDIKLKEHRGDEIAKQIRKLPERHQRKVPIIALTAKVLKEDLKIYKKAGINGVLKKPFNEKQLLNIMAEHLNQ